MSSCPIFFCDPLEDKIVGVGITFRVEDLFVLRPVASFQNVTASTEKCHNCKTINFL
jgi:hypothetical protein